MMCIRVYRWNTYAHIYIHISFCNNFGPHLPTLRNRPLPQTIKCMYTKAKEHYRLFNTPVCFSSDDCINGHFIHQQLTPLTSSLSNGGCHSELWCLHIYELIQISPFINSLNLIRLGREWRNALKLT